MYLSVASVLLREIKRARLVSPGREILGRIFRMCKFELDALMRAQCMHEKSNRQATPMLFSGWAILGNPWPQYLTLSPARPSECHQVSRKPSQHW